MLARADITIGKGCSRTKDLDAQIKVIFERSESSYGSPRIFIELKKEGVEVSESTVSRRMKALEITPKVKKRFKTTTDSKHGMPVAPNILNRAFDVAELGRVWVSDITYTYEYKILSFI